MDRGDDAEADPNTAAQPEFARRVQGVRQALSEVDCDGLLISRGANRRYLSGFTGTSGYLLIDADTAVVMTDFRYTEQAAREVKDFDVGDHGQPGVEGLVDTMEDMGWRRVAFEADDLSVRFYRVLQETGEGAAHDFEWVPTEGLVEEIRRTKEEGEIARMAAAAAVADEAFETVVESVRPGTSERDVALELDYQMRKSGGRSTAFTIIVASGHRGALPHGVASDKSIEPGDMVTVDWGAVYQGYCSDCTRTVAVGGVDERQRRVYNLVRTAQEASLEALEPGMTGREADAVARDIIDEAGHGDHFGHSLGHGVGLAVHEGPQLSSRSGTELAPRMVVTVEPGVYIPGWGGVRIEDLVVLRPGGDNDVLTGLSKDLRIID